MSSPNVIWKMQPGLLKKVALNSVLSGNRKRKDPSRCVVCDSMEPSEGLSVKNGGSGIKYEKLQDLCSFCSNQVWFSGAVKCGINKVQSVHPNPGIALFLGEVIWHERGFMYIIFIYFPKTGWIHLDCFLGIIDSARS